MKIFSNQEKYKKAILLNNKLASVNSEQSQALFENGTKLLENICKMWSARKKILITEVAEIPNIPRQAEIVLQLPDFSGEANIISQVSETRNILDYTHKGSTQTEIQKLLEKNMYHSTYIQKYKM